MGIQFDRCGKNGQDLHTAMISQTLAIGSDNTFTDADSHNHSILDNGN